MQRVLKLLFFILVPINLFLASWYVLHQDIEFTSEIARDFFLLDELHTKKIVLIGPSSSTGLFHGPLWTYLNYPAYVIGGGNPIVVGWWWIVLITIFVVSGFFIAKKLFSEKVAYFFTLMISLYCVFLARGMYNPHGALFVLPFFFFFFIRYVQTLKIKYLIIHVLFAGFLIQFQMAIGVPFFILSFLSITLVCFKQKKKIHLLIFLLIFVTLANFIVFDIRHEFLLSKTTFHFLTSAGRDRPNLISMLEQRINFMTTGIEFLRRDTGYKNLLIFGIFSVFLFFQIRHNKYKRIYLTFLYFYVGYLILSNLNSGGLLYFYLFPLFPFVFLIFSSFVTSKYARLFIPIFLVIYFLNFQNALNDNKYAEQTFFGKSEDSWIAQKEVAEKVFSIAENEFGYYVYAPDVVAYKAKYAMHYVGEHSSKKPYYFQKKKHLYLIVAPPAPSKQFLTHEWWKTNMLHMDKKAERVVKFHDGYMVEKYTLTDKEISVPVEEGIDPGIFFR